MDEESVSEVCQGCIKWDQFKKDCFVYWDKKKHCTMKVANQDELDKQTSMLKS